jgi:molecular chaperone GrpE (heat shock protein)
MKQKWTHFDEKCLLPWMIRAGGYLRKKIENRIRKYHLIYDWKQKAFEDFSAWLAALPEKLSSEKSATDASGALESCDLFTVLSEFTALRQEIRIQSREHGKTLSTLTGFIEAYQETANLFKERTRALSELEVNIRKSSEKRTVLPFLEVRDTLVRGLEASLALSAFKSFFRPAPKGIEGVVEGYEMALRRMDRALASVNVLPVETTGRPFDPKTMKAVDKRSGSGMDKGMVVEELLTGFLRGQELLRTAEVIVSE